MGERLKTFITEGKIMFTLLFWNVFQYSEISKGAESYLLENISWIKHLIWIRKNTNECPFYTDGDLNKTQGGRLW